VASLEEIVVVATGRNEMMLTGVEIECLVQTGAMRIDPFEKRLLRPSSYALRLGPQLLAHAPASQIASVRGLDSNSEFLQQEIAEEGLLVEPGTFYLASSLERITMPEDHAAMLSLASRLARLGLLADFGSNLVHAGFGKIEPTSITFELLNLSKRGLWLEVGMPFCHLVLFRHQSAAADVRASDYSGHGPGPHPARFAP
jgi:dCTP deaminase